MLNYLLGVDINTQQSFEALNQRAVAVVIDPVQSVKGKVVIDCFRLINPQLMMLGEYWAKAPCLHGFVLAWLKL